MTRSLADVRHVLALREAGLGARRIARQTGVPIKTVQGWIADPDHALARRASSGLKCAGACEPWLDLQRAAYSYLFGAYLGDGHIVLVRKAHRLSIYSDERYPGIIRDIQAAMSSVLPNRVNLRNHVGCVAVTSYSQHWPCMFPQHGAGKKHDRPMALAPWQRTIVESLPRPFLKGLIHSDGWRGENVAIRHTDLAIEYRTYSRYQFSNRSKDIRDLCCWALDLIDVHWTQSNAWTISVSRRKDVHYLDSFIGPKR